MFRRIEIVVEPWKDGGYLWVLRMDNVTQDSGVVETRTEAQRAVHTAYLRLADDQEGGA